MQFKAGDKVRYSKGSHKDWYGNEFEILNVFEEKEEVKAIFTNSLWPGTQWGNGRVIFIQDYKNKLELLGKRENPTYKSIMEKLNENNSKI